MKILKRLRFVVILFLTGGLLVFPAAIWWILTGKDILSSTMDKIVIKYWEE
jgi:hypothetical protein